MELVSGPDITVLHHRMAEAPLYLIKPPVTHSQALVHDLVFRFDTDFDHTELLKFNLSVLQCPWYEITRLMIWLLAAPELADHNIMAVKLFSLLSDTAKSLYGTSDQKLYINDVDRREEFIRVCLYELNLKPAGESDEMAIDRLMSVSSAERIKLVKAAQSAERRAREIRKAMARKKAREAADKMTRE